MKNTVTILIPCHNEENTIGICIEKANKYIKEKQIEAEILVVDNKSTDKTKEISEELGARVVKEEKIGYGNALITGIKKAKGDYIIMGDADDSYNFLEIEDFVKNLEEGYDLVIGNRYSNMEKGAMKWSHRYIGTPILTKMLNKKYNLNLKDINCGLRGMKKDKILGLD